MVGKAPAAPLRRPCRPVERAAGMVRKRFACCQGPAAASNWVQHAAVLPNCTAVSGLPVALILTPQRHKAAASTSPDNQLQCCPVLSCTAVVRCLHFRTLTGFGLARPGSKYSFRRTQLSWMLLRLTGGSCPCRHVAMHLGVGAGSKPHSLLLHHTCVSRHHAPLPG